MKLIDRDFINFCISGTLICSYGIGMLFLGNYIGYSDAQKDMYYEFINGESIFTNITNANITIYAEIHDHAFLIKGHIENSTIRSWFNMTIIKEPLGMHHEESYWIVDGNLWKEVTQIEMKEYLDKGNGE